MTKKLVRDEFVIASTMVTPETWAQVMNPTAETMDTGSTVMRRRMTFVQKDK